MKKILLNILSFASVALLTTSCHKSPIDYSSFDGYACDLLGISNDTKLLEGEEYNKFRTQVVNMNTREYASSENLFHHYASKYNKIKVNYEHVFSANEKETLETIIDFKHKEFITYAESPSPYGIDAEPAYSEYYFKQVDENTFKEVFKTVIEKEVKLDSKEYHPEVQGFFENRVFNYNSALNNIYNIINYDISCNEESITRYTTTELYKSKKCNIIRAYDQGYVVDYKEPVVHKHENNFIARVEGNLITGYLKNTTLDGKQISFESLTLDKSISFIKVPKK